MASKDKKEGSDVCPVTLRREGGGAENMPPSILRLTEANRWHTKHMLKKCRGCVLFGCYLDAKITVGKYDSTVLMK